MTQQSEFFNKIKDGALKGWDTHKILPSVSLAQAALESNWGKSDLAVKGKNLFGIKADKSWKKETITINTSEYVSGKKIMVDAVFRKYDSWADSVADHGEFFTSTDWRKNNYKTVIGEADYKKAAHALKSCGYATDPSYANKLINLIEDYNLSEWDSKKEEKTDMTKYLVSFGHGYSKKGAYDTGAVHVEGNTTFTEQEMVRRLRPYLKKWATKAGIDLSFYDNNMYADRAISNYKGWNVTEIHLDAPKGIGGHVIIDDQLNPDNQDKRIAAWIKKDFETVGYVGADGINKRDNLYNVNKAQQTGVNFRLLELFFLSNDQDRNFYLANLDAVAKGLLESIIGKSVDGKAEAAKPVKEVIAKPAEPVKKPAADAKLVVDGWWGSLTTAELQRVLKTPVDGIISGQLKNAVTEEIQGVLYGTGGSLVVKELQKLIGVKVDGYLGEKTIEGLQKFFGTPVDGKLSGPSLLVKEIQKQALAGKLVSKVKAATVKAPAKAPTKAPAAKFTGSKKVQEVQNWVISYGFSVGSKGADGWHGDDTLKGLVKVWQTEVNKQYKNINLKVDGAFGQSCVTAAKSVNIKQGTTGNITKVLQGILICKGFDPKGFDGKFGDGCEKAVIAAQAKNGLKKDGIVGSGTWKTLLN